MGKKATTKQKEAKKGKNKAMAKDAAVETKAKELKAAAPAPTAQPQTAPRPVRNNDFVQIMHKGKAVCEGTRTHCKAILFPDQVRISSSLASLLKQKHPEYQIAYTASK